MFEKHIYDSCDLDMLTIRLIRYQATNSPDNQINFHATFTGMIQAINHVLVMQAVHLEDNPSPSSLAYMFDFPFDHLFQFRHHIKTCHKQVGESRVRQTTFQYGKYLVDVLY